MQTTQRIVREQQGAWCWQTPYRVMTYVAAPGADGQLRWRRIEQSPKYTLAQARRVAPMAECGGIHGRPVMTAENRHALYDCDDH